MNHEPKFCLLAFALSILPFEVMAEPGEVENDLRGTLIRGLDGSVFASYVCGDLNLRGNVSFVGCGTASETFLTPQLGAELSHYRLEYAWRLTETSLKLNLVVGAGMAEGQLGQDAAGFFVNPDQEAATIEAAGPEIMVGTDIWIPTRLKTYDFRFRFDLGATWLPGWRRVGGTSEDFVPFGVITTNARF
jgi:hypothetical protein